MIDEEHVSEEVRLKYRYLDLRREPMQKALRLRHATSRAVREYLDDNGFIDVETPVLYKSTPEGAREFLVPSRIHDGQFYALPQSPQLFKQLLMVAGFDRYYQIVKCFRDEDLRADRQPEFTQIDIETSFLSEREIQDIMEGLVRHVWKKVLDVDLPAFPRLTYAEATSRYGSDKPDLRVKLELDGAHRRREGRGLQGVQVRRGAEGRARRGAARARRQRAVHAQGARRPRALRRDLRREGPRVHPRERSVEARRRRACSRRS